VSAFTDYAENQFTDWFFRGQPLTPPATLYFALMTATPTDAAAGTEVVVSAGTNYSRPSVAASLANWAGTQSAGSTTASTGTGGTTSNNGVITFPVPGTTNWGVIVGVALMDAPSGGNIWIYGALTTSKTVNAGDPAPVFSAGDFQFQWDN